MWKVISLSEILFSQGVNVKDEFFERSCRENYV